MNFSPIRRVSRKSGKKIGKRASVGAEAEEENPH
jgi:hypothetical protein